MPEVTIALSSATLRPLRHADAVSLAHHANDRRVSINLRDRFPFPYTESDAIEFIDFLAADTRQAHCGIEIDGAIVGGIAIGPQEDVERLSGELGYWLGVAYWGRGIMPEAVRAMTAFAHQEMGLRRVHAKVYQGNERSSRVLIKAGFELEGRLRSAIVKDDRVLDAFLFSHVDGPKPDPTDR
jgi:ribosomal-protein-alanine N-acetyltransferase